MKNVHNMQLLEPTHYGDEDLPDRCLVHVALGLLALTNLLVEVTVVGILHDYAQVLVLVCECLFVGNDVRVLN